MNYEKSKIVAFQNRLQNIADEMYATLVRTSGSPVVTEGKDVCCCILDLEGKHLGIQGLQLHSVSAYWSVKGVMEKYEKNGLTFEEGDVFVSNDPYEGGSAHPGDLSIIRPIFHHGNHVAWCFSNCHVLDIGGTSQGGWASTAHSCYEEGLYLHAVKIGNRDGFDADWLDTIYRNVRVGSAVVNDLRAMLAADIVGERRIREIIDEFGGMDTFRDLAKLNESLVEEALRARIAALPDGVYESRAWIEYDGHGSDDVYEINMRVVKEVNRLTFYYSTPHGIVDFYANSGRAGAASLIWCAFPERMLFGIPFNYGAYKSVTLDFGPKGTFLNAVRPGATTCGHMVTGWRTMHLCDEYLALACSLSQDLVMKDRVHGIGWESGEYTMGVATNQFGQYSLFIDLTGIGMGCGAHTFHDGLDYGGLEVGPGGSQSDVETIEAMYPVLFLWRKGQPNTGGPGAYRGGAGIHWAWMLYNTERMNLQGIDIGGEFPTRGAAGGYPGGRPPRIIRRKTNAEQLLKEGKIPVLSDLKSERDEALPGNFSNIYMYPGDVLIGYAGGGSGVGDPLLRKPEKVREDVSENKVTIDIAEKVYGVVLNGKTLEIDRDASSKARRSIREARIGRKLISEGKIDLPHKPLGLVKRGGEEYWSCNYCGKILSPTSIDWEDVVVKKEEEISKRAAEMGTYIRHRTNPVNMLREYFCPDCGYALKVETATSDWKGARMRLTSTGKSDSSK